MEATTSALIEQLIISLEPLESLNKPFFLSPEFWGSIIASLTALFIAVGGARFIKPRVGIKSELELIDFIRFRQVNHYWRLVIKNSGKEIAKGVQVDVTNVVDNGKRRENFLAIPLRWTHLNCESRDILPEQTVYLDVIEHITSSGGDEAKLITRAGGGVKDFEQLKNGKTEVTLTFYQENGKIFSKNIEISWSAKLFFDGRLQGKRWHLTKNGKFIS